ncbi:MAG: hypothetical protein ACYC4I_00330 [Minisyncoccota bacterium]
MHFDPKITTDSIATLIAALIALVVYWLHQKDEKRKAAIILLSEIKDAEESIREIQRSNTVSDYTSVLSENHWKEYQYLFATSLDGDEIELVSRFYRSCGVIEEQLRLIKGYLPLAKEQKVRLTQDKLIDLADRTKNKSDFDLEKKRVLDESFWPNEEWFAPHTPKTKLFGYTGSVQFVISSNAGTRLKKIVNAPWWKLFI